MKFRQEEIILKLLRFSILVITLISTTAFANAQHISFVSIQKKLAKLEKEFKGKIGVYAIDTNSGKVISYRKNILFPIQSTFKVIGVASLLKQSENNRKLLSEKIHYSKKDLVLWHPVTGKYINTGMTLRSLAEATISYSDNPAINFIMKKLGGTKSVIAFAQQIGNKTFKLEHYESNLNSDPKNPDDSSTPKDMALSLQKLVLGNILQQPDRKQLITWMRNNTTGYKRIRAGVPIGWAVADKTGSGSYGIANDIGIVWSPTCKPIVLAIYTVKNKHDAKWQNAVVAETAQIVLNAFSRIDPCFNATNLNM